jgi:GAF domain-containing protein
VSHTGSDALFEGLERIAGLAVAQQTVSSMLDVIVSLAKQLIPRADGVGVTLRHAGEWTTAAQTDGFVLDIDVRQYERDSGPCVSAAKDNRSYRVDDLSAEQRWAGFADDASASGVMSVLSTPLSAGEAATGALNMYSFTTDAFGEDAEKVATVLARHATIAIANKEALGDGELLNAQLREALLSREVIGEAKGILMERDALTSDQAFDALRVLSQAQNRKLREIAEEIVRSVGQRHERRVDVSDDE